MDISESAGREIVDPLLRYLADTQWQGWDNYHEKYRDVLHEHLPSNRSDLINRQINLAAKSVLAGLPNVRLQPTPQGQYWVIIRDIVAIRFKKFDDDHCRTSWNHGTRQSRRINRQESLSDYPDYAWMNAGYIPNALWSTIESMYLAHPRSETSNAWKISLMDDPQISMDFDFSPTPLPPNNPEPPTPLRSQRPRWQLKEGEALPKEQTHGSAR